MKQSENEIKINKTKHFFTQCVLQLWNCSLSKDVVEVKVLIPPARSCQRSESCIREHMILDKTIPELDSVRLFLFYCVLTKKKKKMETKMGRAPSTMSILGRFLWQVPIKGTMPVAVSQGCRGVSKSFQHPAWSLVHSPRVRAAGAPVSSRCDHGIERRSKISHYWRGIPNSFGYSEVPVVL